MGMSSFSIYDSVARAKAYQKDPAGAAAAYENDFTNVAPDYRLNDDSKYTAAAYVKNPYLTTNKEINEYLDANPGYSLKPQEGYGVVRTFDTARLPERGSDPVTQTISVYGKLAPAATTAAAAPPQNVAPAATEAKERTEQYLAEERATRDERLARKAPTLNYTPGPGTNVDPSKGYTPGNGVQAVSNLASQLWDQSSTNLASRYKEAEASSNAAASWLEQFAYTLPKVPDETSDKDLIAKAKEYASIFKSA